jgi:hypothetical protein
MTTNYELRIFCGIMPLTYPLAKSRQPQSLFVPKIKIITANKPILKVIPTTRLLPRPRQESINVITE